MPKNIRAHSASVAQPNTPESDLLPVVEHIVNGTYIDTKLPWSVIVEAAEPGDAMDRIHAMTKDEFEALPKVDKEAPSTLRKIRP